MKSFEERILYGSYAGKMKARKENAEVFSYEAWRLKSGVKSNYKFSKWLVKAIARYFNKIEACPQVE
jgi:hypothetical protein